MRRDETSNRDAGLRRVRTLEGAGHAPGGGLVLAGLGAAVEPVGSAGGLAGGWLAGATLYLGLRLGRVRYWIGGWDAPSFAFGWIYALVTAVGVAATGLRWS